MEKWLSVGGNVSPATPDLPPMKKLIRGGRNDKL